MDTPTIRWELREHQYGPPAHEAYVGTWIVGGASYAMVSQGEPPAYSANCRLPGMRENLGQHPTLTEAQNITERAIHRWFKGLTTEENGK